LFVVATARAQLGKGLDMDGALELAEQAGKIEDFGGAELQGGPLAAALLSQNSQGRANRGPLVISNARVVGGLDLRGAKLPYGLAIRDSTVDTIFLSDADMTSFELTNSTVVRLLAQRVKTLGSFKLEGGQCDSLVLSGAKIGGNLRIGYWRNRNGAGPEVTIKNQTILADGVVVGGYGRLSGLICSGGVALDGATFGRDLDLRAAQISNEVGFALSLDGCSVNGHLRLGTGDCKTISLIQGLSNLRKLRVRGDFRALAGVFNAYGTRSLEDATSCLDWKGEELREWAKQQAVDSKVRVAMTLEGAKIEGSAEFDGSVFLGQVRLVNSRIDGDLKFDGATLGLAYGEQPQATTPTAREAKVASLTASGAQIGGCGFFGHIEELPGGDKKPCRTTGALHLVSTRVRERLLFNDIRFICAKGFPNAVVGLVLRGCKVELELRLPTQGKKCLYDFRALSCGLLRQEPSSWPQNASAVQLDQFVYSLGTAQLGVGEQMLHLIAKHHGDARSFRPAPYKQLETELHAKGMETLARRVGRARRRLEMIAERKQIEGEVRSVRGYRQLLALLKWIYSLTTRGILWCAGYGYSPGRAILLSCAIVLLSGWFIEPAWYVVKDPTARPVPVFLPMLFAADRFIPVINLGVASQFAVAPDHSGALMLDVSLRLLGWMMSTLVIASWSGVVRKP
jgi:hypothetical protein